MSLLRYVILLKSGYSIVDRGQGGIGSVVSFSKTETV